MSTTDAVIRRASRADLPALGRLGALLMPTHYGFDPARFMAPGDDAEEGIECGTAADGPKERR